MVWNAEKEESFTIFTNTVTPRKLGCLSAEIFKISLAYQIAHIAHAHRWWFLHNTHRCCSTFPPPLNIPRASNHRLPPTNQFPWDYDVWRGRIKICFIWPHSRAAPPPPPPPPPVHRCYSLRRDEWWGGSMCYELWLLTIFCIDYL